MEHSPRYIVLFAAAVCAVCAIFVAGSAVSLRDRQEANVRLDVQKKVLTLAGLMKEGEDLSREEIGKRYSDNIVARAVELETGNYAEEIDAAKNHIEERTIAGKTVFIIGAGALIVCLASDVTIEAVEGVAKLKEELKPEIMRVVFKDAGFKNDVVKTNAVQILRQAGIEDVKSL